MGLMDLVRKALNKKVATAIPAILATEAPKPPMRIATIAPIAVAKMDDPVKEVATHDGLEMIRQDRIKAFQAKGISTDDANWLAGRLEKRDREWDDRKSCGECASFYGSLCIQHKEPFGGGGIEVLHRCKVFKPDRMTRLEAEWGLYYNN
jgi:hypothetical protein